MIFDTISPALIILSLFVVAALAPLIARLGENASRIILALAMAGPFVVLLAGSGSVWAGEVWRGSIPWASGLGIDWDQWVSPTGLLMALLVTGIGILVVLFGAAYLSGDPNRGRFFACFFLFAGAMLGLTLTENLMVFFIFWELTSVASYLLIGYYHGKLESRKSALDALLVTGTGGVVLLAGIVLIGQAAGTFQIGELVENRETILNHPLYPGIFFCFLVGAITKSAQFPFHFWLPGAMAAPAPVSAYLHSATMVKAGVFLLAIMHPILGGTELWHYSLLIFGAITMTWGAVVAAVQTDLKRLLAFSTVSALGTLVMLLGIENALAAKTVVVFLIVHALYKGALFMVAGTLEKATGSREIRDLRGLLKSMPALGIGAIFAAASMSGLPPFVGFIAKELLYEVKLETPVVGWGLLICGLVANAANIVVAVKVGVAPFLKGRETATVMKKKPSLFLVSGTVILGVGSLILGLFPMLLGPAVSAVAEQMRMEEVKVKLKLWHGINLVLMLSLLTMAMGFAGYFLRNRLQIMALFLKAKLGWNAQANFRSGLASFLRLTGKITILFQSGNLRQYFATIVATGAALILYAFWKTGFPIEAPPISGFRLDVAVIVTIICLTAVGCAVAKHRMTSILMLGCAGFGIAGLFALYGAPDLAITQILVETLTLALFAIAVYGLPRLEVVKEKKRDNIRALIIACLTGISFTLLTLKALALEFHAPVGQELAARSLPEGYGLNVVNVILVDFRALDTLGEITVLVIAALGVAAMLQGYDSRRTPHGDRMASAVLMASARYTTPAMLIFSIYLLLRGHNEPGGGFIGGLIAAMAIILTHLARPEKPLTFMRMEPVSLSAIGLIFAVLSGLPGLIAEASFMEAAWGPSFSLPVLGKIALGTPLIFDVGVYLVVAGITLLFYQMMERWHASRIPNTQRL